MTKYLFKVNNKKSTVRFIVVIFAVIVVDFPKLFVVSYICMLSKWTQQKNNHNKS